MQKALHLQQDAKLRQAELHYKKLLKSAPKDPQILASLGTLALQRGNQQAAVRYFKLSLAQLPNLAWVWLNLGYALAQLQRYTEAVSSYDQAILHQPDYALAYNNRGVALQALQEFAAALDSYETAINFQADYAEAYFNQANVYKDLNRFEEAIVKYTTAISLQPDYLAAYFNRGLALKEINQIPSALVSFQQVIAINPQLAEAYFQCGLCNYYLKNYQSALASYQSALELNPRFEFLTGYQVHTQLQIADWHNFEEKKAELCEQLAAGLPVIHPFIAHGLIDDPELQLKAAEIWTTTKYPLSDTPNPRVKHPEHTKIRVAYFSADFREHPVAYLTAELFETHNRQQFEIFAFSYGPDTQDPLRQRLEAAFERFIDVRDMSDAQIVALARDLEIDIAVDLGGYTTDSRPGIFAQRAAPLQMLYIGFLGSMAAEFVDYLIADAVLIPEPARQYYREKIIYLPSYQANDSKRQIAAASFSRQQYGISSSAFVFCCFNNTYKITPETFAVWLHILHGVLDSVLMLYVDNQIAAENLTQAALTSGLNAERLVFCSSLPQPEYLARYRLADLFLDTWPYNAGTTASDALWAGVPVLTLSGQTFAGRLAASLLTAIDLPELITGTPADYQAKAIELANNAELFAHIKLKLNQNRSTAALFDIRLFTTHLECAYQQIYARNLADVPPQTLTISVQTMQNPHSTSLPIATHDPQNLQQAERSFQQAWDLHQQGNITQARAFYLQAIQQYPRHYDALHFLGVLETQAGDYAQAIQWLSLAIAEDDQDPSAFYNLGIAQKALQHYQEALCSYEQAILLDADFVEAYNNRGTVLTLLGEFLLAEQSYRRAISLRTDYAEAYNNLGNLYKQLKQYPLALSSYRLAMDFRADYAEACFNHGTVLAELKEFAAALDSYQLAISIQPNFAQAYNGCGLCLQQLKQYPAALRNFQQAIVLQPEGVEFYVDCANFLELSKDYSAALGCIDEAIRLKPGFAELYNNRGIVLKALGHAQLAIQAYDQAIELKADYVEAYVNRGSLFKESGQYQLAIQDYQQAIVIQGDNADAHFSLALSYLQLGHYAEGWSEYEWRWRRQNLHISTWSFSQPRWTGQQALTGKTILLHSEQGLGDTLQFSRYIRLVADLGASIILDVQPSLQPVLGSFKEIEQFVQLKADMPAFDYHCSLLSLPLAFKTRLETIPAAIPYLNYDQNKAALWQSRLGVKTKPRIGLVWSGNASFENDQQRSVSLAEFINILPGDCFEYICLQNELRETDIDTLNAHPPIRYFGAKLLDFSDTAALAANVDVVISTCTSVPHLTAALGLPTWILLSTNPDWRWLLNREDSPWYPSVRLFRQTQTGDWNSVFQQVKAALLQYDFGFPQHKQQTVIDIAVISLSRTPQRLQAFQLANPHLPEFRLFPAVDGLQLNLKTLRETGYIDGSAEYTQGAIGCALSHIELWKQAVSTAQAMTICEDDAILALNFQDRVAELIAELPDDWDFILWGWNFDSILLAELLPGLGDNLLFFDQEAMRPQAQSYLQQPQQHQLYRLKHAMGIPSYTISAQGAAKFLNHVLPIRAMDVTVNFPCLQQTVSNFGIDVMMNKLYSLCNAYVAFPPVVLSHNLRSTSTVQELRES